MLPSSPTGLEFCCSAAQKERERIPFLLPSLPYNVLKGIFLRWVYRWGIVKSKPAANHIFGKYYHY